MFLHWTISGSELSCVTTASMAACVWVCGSILICTTLCTIRTLKILQPGRYCVWVCGSILICTLCTIRTLKILQPFRYIYDTCCEGLGSNRHLHFFNVNR